MNQQVTDSSLATDLSKKIWKTRGARFNSARRLRRRAHLSLCLISLYSAYTLIATIFSAITPSLPPSSVSAINLITISLSLLILIVSVIEGKGGHELTANSLEDNAKNISKLVDKLKTIAQDPHSIRENTQKISNTYDRLINSCPHNHTPTDYNYFLLQQDDLKNKVKNPKLTLLSYHANQVTFVVAAIIPPAVGFYFWISSMC